MGASLSEDVTAGKPWRRRRRAPDFGARQCRIRAASLTVGAQALLKLLHIEEVLPATNCTLVRQEILDRQKRNRDTSVNRRRSPRPSLLERDSFNARQNIDPVR